MAKSIKKIMHREKKLAELSCKSGGFTEEFAKEKFNVNGKRLQALCYNGFFELHEFNIENSEGKLERKRALYFFQRNSRQLGCELSFQNNLNDSLTENELK